MRSRPATAGWHTTIPAVVLTAVLILSGAPRAMQAHRLASNRTDAADALLPSISYDVTVDTSFRERFLVEATLQSLSADTLDFYFPIWAPGAYDIVNFGAYVSDFTATDQNGHPLKVLRGDTNTFHIVGATDRMSISYVVDDVESLPNAEWFGTSDVEQTFAYANGPALFGYPGGHKDAHFTVRYHVPPSWDLAVALDRVGGDSSHTFRASDYDELVDAPMQTGTFQSRYFTVRGVRHRITVTAPERLSDATLDSLAEATRKVVQIYSGFYGEIPYDYYVFQQYLISPQQALERRANAYGALEHRNSSTYMMPYTSGSSIVDMLVPVIAHEYWHVWSPKRVHVSTLGPFDYQHAPRTSSLWFAEGITEYYARLLLVRAGMIAPEEFLSQMQRDMAQFRDEPQRTSIAELSRSIAERSLMQVMDLYTKGPVIAMLLDATIRHQTDDKHSLDDVMRYFNTTYGHTGKTFGDDEIIPIMEKFTGARLQPFFDHYIAGTDTLPIDSLLPQMGLTYGWTVDTMPALGVEAEPISFGLRISSITPGGSADTMGLNVGDVLREFKFGSRSLNISRIAHLATDLLNSMPAQLTAVTVLRNGKEIDVPAHIIPTPVRVRRLMADPHASELARQRRHDMMGF